jgi:hypothetical protein
METSTQIGTSEVITTSDIATVTMTSKKKGPKPGQKMLKTEDFITKYLQAVTTTPDIGRQELADSIGINLNLMLSKRMMVNKTVKDAGKKLKFMKGTEKVLFDELPLPGSTGRGRSKIDWTQFTE